MQRPLKVLFWLTAFVAPTFGCETFDPPPDVKIIGSDNGIMSTAPADPLVLEVSEAFVRSTLRLKIVPAILDGEKSLLDETKPPDLEQFRERIIAAYDGAREDDEEATFGAKVEIQGRRITVTPDKAFGSSLPYLVLVEPGLEDLDGHATVPRDRLPFTFVLPGGGPNSLPSGYFYWLLNVDFLSTQIQTYAYMEVDPVTGAWRSKFTNGNRLSVLNTRPGCPSCDGDTPICALVPNARCVKPSEKQVAIEEFVDFLPEPDPPDGYVFTADGFVRDEADGSIGLGTAPFLIDVTIGSGAIRVQGENSKFSGSFVKHPTIPGRWQAKGSISVDKVKINGFGEDPTKGNFEAISLSQAEVDELEAFGFPIPTDLF